MSSSPVNSVVRMHEGFVREKLVSAKSEDLKAPQTLLFLHLLGMDTNGHVHKPGSEEVTNNLILVDRELGRLYDALENFFSDNSTAYIFTSDHGMTDWGSHGDGSSSETNTPLIVWGSGVASGRRHDVEQLDVAPLIASLIGVPIPVNSIGILPHDFLAGSLRHKGLAFFQNCLQRLRHLRRLEHLLRGSAFSFVFRPYTGMDVSREEELISEIRRSLDAGKSESFTLMKRFMDLSAEGVHYYERYHTSVLTWVVAAGFLGWMIALLFILVSGELFIKVKIYILHIKIRQIFKFSH